MLLLIWLIPCAMLLAFQYLFGERYLMILKGRTKAGYIVVSFSELVVVVLGVYLMIFVDYMEALGLGYLILNSYLFHKFTRRCAKKGLI